MKSKYKLLLSILMIFPLIGSSFFLGNATVIIEPMHSSPIGIVRPQGLLAGRIGTLFLGFIRNLESANFTGDTVYYTVHSDTGQYSYQIRNNIQNSYQIENQWFQVIKTQINLTLNQLKENLTRDVSQELVDFFTNLYNEVNSHSSLTIEHTTDSDLNIITSIDRKVITIFFDADRSVIEALDTIKNNGTINKQPFTGDEVFTTIFLSLAKDKVSGKHKVLNNWTYEDDTSATYLKRFFEGLTQNRWLGRELEFLYRSMDMGILKSLANPNHDLTIPLNSPRILSYGKFLVSQLLIDELALQRTVKGLAIQKFDYKYIEHQMLGNLVYNDTNENGYMDIGSRNITLGLNTITFPTIGDEALYRLDIRTIENRTYTAPNTVNDILSFGAEYEGITGRLHPIGHNRDDAIFNDTLASEYDIDSVSSMFHYSITENKSVKLKFDYFIGEWSPSEDLDGLSFNQIFSTTVMDSEKTIWRRGNDTEISDDIENSTKVSRMRFGASSIQPFGEIQLDDIPYTWDNTDDLYAVGQLLPLNLISMTFGRITSESDQIMSVMRSVDRRTYIYSISYPKWDGKSILHDPAYIAAGGLGAEVTDDTDGGLIPGFEFPSIILALSMIAIPIIIRKRGMNK